MIILKPFAGGAATLTTMPDRTEAQGMIPVTVDRSPTGAIGNGFDMPPPAL